MTSVIVCSDTLTSEVCEVGGEGGVGEVVVGDVQDLQGREGPEPSGQLTETIQSGEGTESVCSLSMLHVLYNIIKYCSMHVHA